VGFFDNINIIMQTMNMIDSGIHINNGSTISHALCSVAVTG